MASLSSGGTRRQSKAPPGATGAEFGRRRVRARDPRRVRTGFLRDAGLPITQACEPATPSPRLLPSPPASPPPRLCAGVPAAARQSPRPSPPRPSLLQPSPWRRRCRTPTASSCRSRAGCRPDLRPSPWSRPLAAGTAAAAPRPVRPAGHGPPAADAATITRSLPESLRSIGRRGTAEVCAGVVGPGGLGPTTNVQWPAPRGDWMVAEIVTQRSPVGPSRCYLSREPRSRLWGEPKHRCRHPGVPHEQVPCERAVRHGVRR